MENSEFYDVSNTVSQMETNNGDLENVRTRCSKPVPAEELIVMGNSQIDGTSPISVSQPSQGSPGNMKRFRKNRSLIGSGCSSALPIIIGGSDLVPHIGKRASGQDREDGVKRSRDDDDDHSAFLASTGLKNETRLKKPEQGVSVGEAASAKKNINQVTPVTSAKRDYGTALDESRRHVQDVGAVKSGKKENPKDGSRSKPNRSIDSIF